MNETDITVTVNGTTRQERVPDRLSLADLLRERLGLTGTHLGCEHGVCGACTVLVDGQPMRSCIILSAACDGSDITTVEGLQGPIVDALRETFCSEHGLQCGFCTPGMLVTGVDVISRIPELTPDRVREELGGNICRCTGYVGIVRAFVAAAQHVNRDQESGTTNAARPAP